METNKDFETYLFLGTDKISISVYDKQNLSNLYFKEEIYNDKKKDLDLQSVKYFLEENIYKIEKILRKFIKNVNLIIDSSEFLTVQLSIKKNNYRNEIIKSQLIHLLNEAKDVCSKTISEKKIIHMIIDRYLVDNKSYQNLPKNLKCDFFSLDINFICLSQKYIDRIEKTLGDYQISLNHILQLKYVRSFFDNNHGDYFKMSMKIISGYNPNEVLIIPKEVKNRGFFERFFNFFN